MATLPPGTLMQRAAAGLARRCALLLDERGGVYGATRAAAGRHRRQRRRHALRRRPAGRPGRRGPRAAAATRRGRTRADWPRCGRPVVGPSSDLPTEADLVVDGIVGIGASGGLREPAAAAGRPARRAARARRAAAGGGRGRRAQRGRRSTPGDVPARRTSAVTADVTVTFGCLKPAHVVGPAAVRWPARSSWSTSAWGPGCGPTPAVRVPTRPTSLGWWPRRGADVGQVHPRRGRRRDRLGHLPGRRGAVASAARWPARPAWSGTPAAPATTCSGSIRR